MTTQEKINALPDIFISNNHEYVDDQEIMLTLHIYNRQWDLEKLIQAFDIIKSEEKPKFGRIRQLYHDEYILVRRTTENEAYLNQMRDIYYEMLVYILTHKNNVWEIDIDSCRFTPEQLITIINLIDINRIKYVSFNRNHITNEVLNHIIYLIQNAPQLHTCIMYECDLDDVMWSLFLNASCRSKLGFIGFSTEYLNQNSLYVLNLIYELFKSNPNTNKLWINFRDDRLFEEKIYDFIIKMIMLRKLKYLEIEAKHEPKMTYQHVASSILNMLYDDHSIEEINFNDLFSIILPDDQNKPELIHIINNVLDVNNTLCQSSLVYHINRRHSIRGICAEKMSRNIFNNIKRNVTLFELMIKSSNDNMYFEINKRQRNN